MPIVRVVLATLLTIAAQARAETEAWKRGVTPAQMETARKLLDEGNTFLLERDYAAALALYEKAIASWDHPAIRFNMVRCLIQLDRSVEASENLERALAYGAAPLEDTVYNEALAYQKLLANQVATIVVECKQAGVEVTLDGKPLLTCPGKHERRIAPGAHQLVGRKAGFLTRTAEVFALGGKRETVALSLDPVSARGKITHRWSTWVPWSVLGAGAAVTGGGFLVQRLSLNSRDEYQATLARDCKTEPCAPGYADEQRQKAVLQNRIAIGLIGVGGATIVVSGVLLYMNRGRVVYPEAEVMPTVTPVRGGGTVGVTARF